MKTERDVELQLYNPAHETCLENNQDLFYIKLTESVLQTCVYRFCRPALLALDLAAPVEDACAPLDHHHLLSLVAPAAAHQIAAVDAEAGVVALSSVGAEDAERGILLTERRRLFQVNEIFRPGWLVLRIVRLQLKVVTLPACKTVPMLVHGVTRRVDVHVTAHAIRIADHYPGGAVEAVL